jgi:hypothetical protein
MRCFFSCGVGRAVDHPHHEIIQNGLPSGFIMIKKSLLVICLLALFTTGAHKPPLRMAQLTVINKAGLKIEIELTGKYQENTYYIRIPQGDHVLPAEKTFSLVPDTYSTNLYFIELWDPVYGYSCTSKSQTLEIKRNVRVVVLPCDRTPVNGGELPSMAKYGGASGGRGR